MCNLNSQARVVVKSAVDERLSFRQPFTGYNVYQDLPEPRENSTEVSAYVRELFNQGDMPGWGSMQVVPKKGPVAYFKISPSMSVAKFAKKIRDNLEDLKAAEYDAFVEGDHGDGVDEWAAARASQKAICS